MTIHHDWDQAEVARISSLPRPKMSWFKADAAPRHVDGMPLSKRIFDIALALILLVPLSIVMVLGVGLFSPTGDMDAALAVVIVTYILTIVVTVVVGAVSSVVQSATTGLIYIDIRMRKEGLDLELSRFVEARQAGDSSIADPYLLRQQPPVA